MRGDRIIMIPITWQGECSCSWQGCEEVLQGRPPTLDPPRKAVSCYQQQIVNVNDIELNLLCVVQDVVLWHMVVDHWHAMVVPNKCRHSSRCPTVSLRQALLLNGKITFWQSFHDMFWPPPPKVACTPLAFLSTVSRMMISRTLVTR